MQILINTDRNIEGHEALAAEVSAAVERSLSRMSHRITRVEVHLSDEDGQRSGHRDKRCVMGARIEGRPPIAVNSGRLSICSRQPSSSPKCK